MVMDRHDHLDRIYVVDGMMIMITTRGQSTTAASFANQKFHI